MLHETNFSLTDGDEQPPKTTENWVRFALESDMSAIKTSVDPEHLEQLREAHVVQPDQL